MQKYQMTIFTVMYFFGYKTRAEIPNDNFTVMYFFGYKTHAEIPNDDLNYRNVFHGLGQSFSLLKQSQKSEMSAPN